MGMSPEDEIARHVSDFEEWLDVKLDWYQIPCIYEKEIKPRTELIIFDFGGMTFGNSLAETNSSALIEWATAHPDALIFIASGFTYRHSVTPAMEERGFGALPNVVSIDDVLAQPWETARDAFPVWFRDGVKGPDSVPVPEPVCMRCRHLVSNHSYGGGEAHICKKCSNLVCGGCWSGGKKKLCGTCDGWDNA